MDAKAKMPNDRDTPMNAAIKNSLRRWKRSFRKATSPTFRQANVMINKIIASGTIFIGLPVVEYDHEIL